MMKNPEFYKHDAQGKIIFPYDWSDVAWPQLRKSEAARLHDRYVEVLDFASSIWTGSVATSPVKCRSTSGASALGD